jgi:hypothetical protein
MMCRIEITKRPVHARYRAYDFDQLVVQSDPALVVVLQDLYGNIEIGAASHPGLRPTQFEAGAETESGLPCSMVRSRASSAAYSLEVAPNSRHAFAGWNDGARRFAPEHCRISHRLVSRGPRQALTPASARQVHCPAHATLVKF